MQRYRIGYATEFRATGLGTAETGETLTDADQRSRSGATIAAIQTTASIETTIAA
jgi:hypothetical protein